VDHVVLMVPGIGDSDQGHWQSIWERESVNYHRVGQKDWDNPTLNAWLKSLSEHVAAADKPLFLVAHSLGCALVAHWAARQTTADLSHPSSIRGAVLVSPGDIDAPNPMTSQIRSFVPMPLSSLVFPSIVVASDDDQWVKEERARYFAECWGSEFVSAGSQGHITTSTGHGEWTEGRKMLSDFVADQMIQNGDEQKQN